MKLLEFLMNDFLHISKNVSVKETENLEVKIERDDDLEVSISEITGIDVDVLHNNIDYYVSVLDTENGLKDKCIRDGSKLLDRNNNLSLLSMVAYAESKDENLDEWLTEYAERHNTYFVDQRKNFLHMKYSFDSYLAKNKS